MKSWRLIFAIFSVNLILTNAEEQTQQVVAELRNQTSEARQEEIDEIGKILKNVEAVMDPAVDPCENFYQFVCGKFSNKSVSAFDYFYEEFKRRIIPKYEQEEPLESENKLTIIKHSRNIYKSCKETKNEKSFNDFILRDLEAIGGWPALKGDSWNKSAFDWKRSVFKAGNIIIWTNYLFNIRIDNSTNMIYLALDPIDYDNKTAFEFAARLGGNNSIVHEELEYVNVLSKTFLNEYSSYINPDQDPVKITLQNLTENYPFYPWLEYLQYIAPNIQLNDTIVIYRSSVMENLFALLNNTDQRLLANIAAWNRVSNLHSFSRKHDRLNDCFDITFNVLKIAPHFMYYHELLHDNKTIETKQFAEEISNKIRQQFIEMLRNADWIYNKTYSLEKLERINYQFGYPPNLVFDNLLNNHYEKLQLNQTNLYDKLLIISEFQNQSQSNGIILKHRHELIKYLNDNINLPEAKYRGNFNNILVMLSLLQSQFIDLNNPMWMNFAAFGSQIGHEFGKILDPNFNNGESFSWPENSTSYIEYQKKLRCLNDMYRDIANVSRDIPNDENELPSLRNYVADYLGYKAAYLAYKSSPVKGNSRTLHQKEYSPNQLFWIYSTNGFCAVNRPIFWINEDLKLKASLSNIDGFAKDFNCPENSPMNRQPKCNIF